MAKVTGPLMSVTASGSFGKAMVFAKVRGQAYVRQLVIPQNTNTEAQQIQRSIIGVLAKAIRAVLTLAQDTAVPAVGSQFFVDALAVTPASQTWASYLQQVLNPNFATLVSAYGVLDGTHKGYFVSAGESIGLASYTDKASVVHTAGEQLYMLGAFAVSYLSYTGFTGGIAVADATILSDFADYVNLSIP